MLTNAREGSAEGNAFHSIVSPVALAAKRHTGRTTRITLEHYDAVVVVTVGHAPRMIATQIVV